MVSAADIGADARDVEVLNSACEQAEAGLIVVTSTDPALAHAAALATARRDTTRFTFGDAERLTTELDIHDARPTAVNWSVQDVETQILAPARLRPIRRAHIVVGDAHRMTQMAADRVLKAVEEPRTNVLYWFTGRTGADLSATLLSRAAYIIQVAPTPPAQRERLLIDAGATPAEARQTTADADDNVRLALSVTRHHDQEWLTRYAVAPARLLSGLRPAETAEATAATVARLAHGLAATRRLQPWPASIAARTAWEKLTPAGRAEARGLTSRLLDSCVTQAEHQVTSANTAADLTRIDRLVTACASARAQLATNAPPAAVLGGLAASAFLSMH